MRGWQDVRDRRGYRNELQLAAARKGIQQVKTQIALLGVSTCVCVLEP